MGMTEQPGPQTPFGETGRPPGTTATAPRPSTTRTFRRSRTDRTLAGVCGGIAESLGMDPVIVRVLVVVLTFFGGAGIIVYGACWILMPEDDRESSLAERAIARGGSSSWPVLVLAGVIGLAVVLGAGWVIDERGVLLIALVVIAAILLARRDSEQGATVSPATTSPQTEPPGAEPSATAPPTTWSSDPEPSEWSSTGSGWSAQPAAPQWTPSSYAATAPLPPLPPEPPRPRSLLGRVTFALVLLALGVLATADLGGADVPSAAYPALIVAGAGLGLLVGTRYGRGRWLIALGVLGTLALPPAVFADSYRGDWVDQSERAIAPADVGRDRAGVLLPRRPGAPGPLRRRLHRTRT